MEKILCIYHSSDADGWMSGAIVKKWFFEKYPNGIDYPSPYLDHSVVANLNKNKSTLTLFGWNYGQEIPDMDKLNKHYTKIIMCDVSFPPEEMLHLDLSFGTNFIYIDHHISAINKLPEGFTAKGIRDTSLAACELTWKYFFRDTEIPELVELLGKYDTFRHMGTEDEERVRIFQFGARTMMSNVEDCYKYLNNYLTYEYNKGKQDAVISIILTAGQNIYDYLLQESVFIRKSEFEVMIQGYKFLCVNQASFNPKNFGIDFHKEGYDGYCIFRYAASINKWRFTFYSEEVDVSKIATFYGGGGHKGAAGAEVDTETLLDIIENKKKV